MNLFVRLTLSLLCALHPLPSLAAPTNDTPPVLLANIYQPNIDPKSYWISEKLDGVRGIWDGKTLRFRSGNIVNAPAWFTDALPKTPLDGEMWIGRGSFDRLSAIVRKQQPVDEEWRQVHYMIFELPKAPGSFTERVAKMHAVIQAAKLPWLIQVAQFRVADRAALMRKLKEVVRQGGEGLMLHRADALFVGGRNDALLKLKPLQDTEAQVVGYVPGKGRNAGRLGALWVETPEGRRFRIGTGFSDEDRNHPPPIGSTITYRYRDFTSGGLPRFASYMRIHENF